MAWRCRFLAARPSQDGRVVAENDLVKNCRVHPTHWLISTQVMVQGDEAPLDWAALQDVCAYEGFGEVHGEEGDGADGDGAEDSSDSDSDASDSSGGEPLFGPVAPPRVEADL